MNQSNRQAAVRGGFTLIELLVVIGIISILVALTAGAYVAVFKQTQNAEAGSEVGQMASKMETFQVSHKVDYVPSKIKLSETMNYPARATAGSLDAISVAFLHQCWPMLDLVNGKVDWNGDGTISGDYTLEGEECLVFFLSGIPANQGGAMDGTGNFLGTGFSTNPKNPAAHIGAGGTVIAGASVDPPLFEFKTARVYNRLGGTNRFCAYLDPFSDPGRGKKQYYAYFSSYNNLLNAYQPADCQSLVPQVLPQTSGNPRQSSATGPWMNKTSFQIISAGSRADYTTGPIAPGGS